MSSGQLLPGVFSPVIEQFTAVFRPSGKGSLTADMAEFSSGFVSHLSLGIDKQSTATPAPRPLREALQCWMLRQPDTLDLVPPNVISYDKKIDIAGTTYRPRNIAWGDSFILVGTEIDWELAQIRSILSIEQPCGSGKEIVTLLSISRFRPLSTSDAAFDNYKTFPYVGGRIYYSEELPEEVIGQGEVLSHFTYTPDVCGKISRAHFHALPLTRVRFLSPFTFHPLLKLFHRTENFSVFCCSGRRSTLGNCPSTFI